jgi:hypothetical protein
MAKKKNEEWLSIEDLLAEADKVNVEVFVYKGKDIVVPWQELRMEESPSFSDFLSDMAPETELSPKDMMGIGEKIAEEMVYRMIAKGQNTQGKAVWSHEQWERLPLTLRKMIVNRLTSSRDEKNARF